MYINGGIYFDIKYECTNGFKFIDLTEEEYFIRDHDTNNVYTALIICNPKNQIMLKSIEGIVNNVKTKFYGSNCLDPTGPGLLGKFFSKEEKQNLKLYHTYTVSSKINEFYIVYNNMIILKFYNNYREEQSKNQKKEHYSILWGKKSIYNL